VKRGEIYVGRLDPIEGSEQAGTRPVIVVSRDAINDTRRVVIVVPVTTDRGRRLLPTQVQIRSGDGGLHADSVALCEQVRALSKTRLGAYLGALAPTTMDRVDRALRLGLALD
jgi:mRNA interferase MazF